MKRQSLKSLELMESCQPATQKPSFDSNARKLQKLCCKHSKEIPILLNFVNFSTIFFSMIAAVDNR